MKEMIISKLLEKVKDYKPDNKYNIFDTLNLNSDETKLHSMFIYDLLNPRGKHGKGEVFIEQFFKLVLSKISINANTAVVNREIDYGNVDNKSDEPIGGRLDLQIITKEYAIGIENKIYADDQKYQLLRYFNSLKKNFEQKKIVIFYLTLTGNQPDLKSISKSKTHELKNGNIDNLDHINNMFYYTISYKDHIKPWLSKILTLDVITNEDLRLKNSIEQYIEIIDNIIRRNEMIYEINKEIKKIKDIQDKITDLYAYQILIKESESIIRAFQQSIIEDILEKIKLDSAKPCSIELKKKNEFKYYYNVNDEKDIKLLFKFVGKELIYGFTSEETLKDSLHMKLEELSFRKVSGNGSSFNYKHSNKVSLDSNKDVIQNKIDEIESNLNKIIPELNKYSSSRSKN